MTDNRLPATDPMKTRSLTTRQKSRPYLPRLTKPALDDASVALDSGLNTLKVVFNWFTELNEKVPTKN
ncbi:MAG: hypothetical protein IIC50_17675 [Planctomycetes bacterium]|nr:hypothetical protein [Planctomycetota bacterium]